MSEDGRERRDSGRAILELPIEYEQLNPFLSDYTHNISRGGTFIRTERALPIGAELSFRIRAPNLGDPLILRGMVRWVVQPAEASPQLPAGMGIAFVYDSPEHRRELEARIDRLIVEVLGQAAFAKLMSEPLPEERGEND